MQPRNSPTEVATRCTSISSVSGVDVLNLRRAVPCVNHFIAPLVGFFAAA